MNPWWLGLDPAQATVACGEHSHRLRWEQGELLAVDHDDPEGERALAALGGERCTCVEVLDAWSRHARDPRVLVLATRGPTDLLAADAEWTAQLGTLPLPATATAGVTVTAPTPRLGFLRAPDRRHARAGAATPTRPPVPARRLRLGSQSESELVALLGLGGGLQDRLVATVADAWAQSFADGVPALVAVRPTLQASMHGRLSAVLRTWLGRIDLEVELEFIEARETPTLSERAGVITAELPFAWLAEVWSRDLAMVMGRFCLAAETEDGTAWRLTTVGPDLGPPAVVVLERPPA